MNLDSTTALGAPAEATVFNCSILTKDSELYKYYPAKLQYYAKMGVGSIKPQSFDPNLKIP